MTTEESFKKYPYFYYPAIEALESAEGEERQKLLRRIACGVGPLSALRTLIGVDPEEFRDFYGELEQPDLTTTETIDMFLEKFAPDSSPTPSAAPAASADAHAADVAAAEAADSLSMSEIPIAPPAIDYASSLLGDDDDLDSLPDDDTSSLLSSFLGPNPAKPKTSKPATAKNPVAPEESKPTTSAENTEPLSEALVKIMIKNGNYRKALEIITEINLKNPKKSVYFADQIRFLQKLVLLQDNTASNNTKK